MWLPARLALNIGGGRAYSQRRAVDLDLGHPVPRHILNLAR
jgi:hypothetical protein